MPFPCPVGGRHRQSLESSEGQPTNQQPTNQCAHICRPVEPLVHRLIKLGLYVLLRSLRVFRSGSRRVPRLTHVTETPAPPSCMHTGGICNLDQNAHTKPSSSLDNQFRYRARTSPPKEPQTTSYCTVSIGYWTVSIECTTRKKFSMRCMETIFTTITKQPHAPLLQATSRGLGSQFRPKWLCHKHSLPTDS